MLFTQALKINPRSAVAEYHLGYLAFLEGRQDEAIDWYQKSLEDHPDFVETHIGLATAFYASGRLDDALRGAARSSTGRIRRGMGEVQDTLTPSSRRRMG